MRVVEEARTKLQLEAENVKLHYVNSSIKQKNENPKTKALNN